MWVKKLENIKFSQKSISVPARIQITLLRVYSNTKHTYIFVKVKEGV